MIFTSEPNLSKKESLLIKRALDRNLLSSYGPDILKFEKKFSKLYGFRYSLALNSGTSALHIALLSIGIKKDDLIIVPDFTFAGTVNAIIYCGAQPWFHDINEKNLSIDLEQVKKSLKYKTILKKGERFHKITGQRVSCILPVTTFGNSINFDEIIKIKKNFKTNVLIDGASAHFAKYKNKKLGKFKLDFTFSFNGNKGMTTGSGGIFCTNSKKKYSKAKILINVGQDKVKYQYKAIGYNYKMNSIQANIGIAQLSKYNYFYKQKKKIYEFYNQNIKSNKFIKNFFRLEKGKGYFWIYPIKVKKKKYFLNYLKKKNIFLSNFWSSLSKQIPYKNFINESLKVSKTSTQDLVCLPSSTFLRKKDLHDICKLVNKFK